MYYTLTLGPVCIRMGQPRVPALGLVLTEEGLALAPGLEIPLAVVAIVVTALALVVAPRLGLDGGVGVGEEVMAMFSVLVGFHPSLVHKRVMCLLYKEYHRGCVSACVIGCFRGVCYRGVRYRLC